MSRDDAGYPDPDDMFADTRMTFGEHIEDLRTHLLRAIYGFIIGFLIAIPLGKPVLRFISAPVVSQLKVFNDRYDYAMFKQISDEVQAQPLDKLPPMPIKIDVNVDSLLDKLQERLNLPPGPPREKQVLENMLPGVEALLASLRMETVIDWRKHDETHYTQLSGIVANPLDYAQGMQQILKVLRPDRLATFSVTEPFMVLIKVIMMTGLVIASPWVFYQLWSFVAAGLYPGEKRLVNVYLPFSIVLFLGGVAVCEFVVIPKAIEALLWFNEYLGFQPDLRLSEWLGFAIFMPIVFGISFQTPLVMFFLEKVGLFTVEGYRSKRRLAWFVMVLFAGIVVPSTDAFSMLFLWIPMCLLYELGIGLCIFYPSTPSELETSDSEEMVEV